MRSPLQELGFTKAEIRQAAQELGLPNWDAPSARVSLLAHPLWHITPAILDQVGRAELALRARSARCVRHHDRLRIEVPPADFDRLLAQRQDYRGAAEAGYQPYRST